MAAGALDHQAPAAAPAGCGPVLAVAPPLLLAIACLFGWLALTPAQANRCCYPAAATGAHDRSRTGLPESWPGCPDDWFCRTSVLPAGALVWLGYVAMVGGWPPRIAANLARLEPGFVAPAPGPAFWVALAATLACRSAIARSARTKLRGIVHWCYGTTPIWLLVMTLWLPWIDYGRSYRSVAHSLHAALLAERRPAANACGRPASAGRTRLFAYFDRSASARMPRLPMDARAGFAHAPPPVPAGARLAWKVIARATGTNSSDYSGAPDDPPRSRLRGTPWLRTAMTSTG